ncbi:MAG: FecR domain-containing protein [Deltaproteobacteria bacterium]|nr:FecR domain-containing protein [Deltaproteobacteria bacterium]
MRILAASLILFAACTPEPEPTPTPVPTAAPPKIAAPASVPASAPASVPVAKPLRRFLQVTGEVTLDGRPAAVDMEIPATAKLHTGKAARAVLTLEKGGVIEVRENADVDIGASPKHKISLKLMAGILWSMLPKGRSDYEVITENAVAGARGTTFYVDATKKNLSMVCICDGDVELGAGVAAGKHVVTHDEHHGYKIAGKGKGAKAKMVGKAKDMPNHPNAERAVLQALVAAD